ncbi:MAG TPA: alpha/beta fold hydrolase [Acidimicrobiales bacterium]|nr:alpha/beta fold hydrolase [Acidimicrobiales bacterium]
MNQLDVPIQTGDGPPVVLLHGFAMRPATYGGLVRLLAERCRVYVPDLFAVPGRWSYPKVLDAFVATVEGLGLERCSLIGHSFGGGIALGFASRWPERVVEIVFSDSLAASREWKLAAEVLHHPVRLLRLATPTAGAAFARTCVDHPRQLVDAAWWGFTSSRENDSEDIAREGIPAHVLWANRDSILARSDGMRFATELNATFSVASGPAGEAYDHDWMFEQPRAFFDHLDALGLKALSS